jgi:hypothetical protein
MLNSQDHPYNSREETEGRLNILRRQITFYRNSLRQSSDAEFAAIYTREIMDAQRELADLWWRGSR